MTFHILNNQEKKQILKSLNNQFSIVKIPGLIVQTGTERLFLFTGDFNEKHIKKLIDNKILIERIGVYIGKIIGNNIRLSIEGAYLFKDQINKNIFVLENKKDLESWMSGNELNLKPKTKGFLVMKYKDDFLGTGKASENKITNFIPKSRRLKKSS